MSEHRTPAVEMLAPCTKDATLCGGSSPTDCWSHSATNGVCYRIAEAERVMRRAYDSVRPTATTEAEDAPDA